MRKSWRRKLGGEIQVGQSLVGRTKHWKWKLVGESLGGDCLGGGILGGGILGIISLIRGGVGG